MGTTPASYKSLRGLDKPRVVANVVVGTGETLPMNAPSEMSHEDVLRVKLEVLKREHRDLDAAIDALQMSTNPDQLMLKRLKTQKLRLKDRIAVIEDELVPDIIA